MTDVFDVAEAILQAKGGMSSMKLQKLVYYCQAWNTVWNDDVLFPSRIEAWKDGPICPDLWREHAGLFMVNGIPRGNPDRLTKSERRTVSKVLKFYSGKTAQWLSDLTHMEAPWKDARRGIPAGAFGNVEITPAAMSAYYSTIR